MKNWRQHLGVLIVFAVLGILLRWLLPDPVPRLDRPLPPVTIAESEPSLRTPDPKPIPKPLPPPPRAVEQATGAEATQQGIGWIRCELGSTDLPEGRVTGAFERAEITGGVLIASVRTESGHSSVHGTLAHDDRRNPIAAIQARQRYRHHPLTAVRWSEAGPGQQGVCTTVPLESIEIAVRITGEAPEGRLSVQGCGAGARPDEDGVFTVQWFASVPCGLHAVVQDGYSRGEGPELWVNSPTDTSVTVQAPTEILSRHEQLLATREKQLARLDELLELDGALDRAYADPDLSAESRAVLERRIRIRDLEIDQLEQVLERPVPDESELEEDMELIWNDELEPDRVFPGLERRESQGPGVGGP